MADGGGGEGGGGWEYPESVVTRGSRGGIISRRAGVSRGNNGSY